MSAVRSAALLVTFFCVGAIALKATYTSTPCAAADAQYRRAQAAADANPHDRVLQNVALAYWRAEAVQCAVVPR